MSVKSPRTKQQHNKEKASEAKRVQFVGYKNVVISEKEKAQFEEWHEGANVLEFLVAACLEHYKVSVYHDAGQDVFIASLFDQSPDSRWAGYILNVRARSPEAALARLMYYHFEVQQGDWGQVPTRGGDDLW